MGFTRPAEPPFDVEGWRRRPHLERIKPLAQDWALTRDGSFEPEVLSERYGIDFDMESVPRICAEHGLTHPLLG